MKTNLKEGEETREGLRPAGAEQSLTPLRSCFKTFSERTRAPAAWYTVWQAFRSARRSSWRSFSRWRGKGAAGGNSVASPVASALQPWLRIHRG
jgi:hypothetical protein